MEPKDLAFAAADIIDSKKGEAIVVMDVHEVADIAEYFVICTASNKRLVDALVDDLEEGLKLLGEDPVAIEGREECTWVLVDYGPVIVHIFQPQTREYYRLERLWSEAPSFDVCDGEVQPREVVAPRRAPQHEDE